MLACSHALATGYFFISVEVTFASLMNTLTIQIDDFKNEVLKSIEVNIGVYNRPLNFISEVNIFICEIHLLFIKIYCPCISDTIYYIRSLMLYL